MKKIIVHQDGIKKTIEVEENAMLLAELRQAGYEVWAPCGGSGSCGKCKVTVKGEGAVTSCMYPVQKDLEVLLPNVAESKVLVAQHKYTQVLPFMPGKASELSYYPFGVAIDIGTTTMVFYLINLISGTLMQTRSCMNPQAKYGGDVISRIDYCGKNEGGLHILQKEVLDVIDAELAHLAEVAGISSNEMVKLTIAGNTTMLHFLLGVDATSIALAPYKPSFVDKKVVKGKELLNQCHPEAELTLLPSISAYVGADIVSGLASLQPSEDIKNYLFIDIGTNGEMALVANTQIYCCSTAAGPAFEGANISCGMGAFPGAISSFNGSIKTIADEPAKGLCGSGLIDVVALCLNKGLINMEGLMEHDFVLASAEETGTNEPVVLSPMDVREVQLAKSAIISGVKIMMAHAGLTFNNLDALFLAGGFGNYINAESAMRIGLLPEEMKGKVVPIGNASGTGATLACRSTQFMDMVDEMLARTHYLELATHPDFAMEYAMNMYFS